MLARGGSVTSSGDNYHILMFVTNRVIPTVALESYKTLTLIKLIAPVGHYPTIPVINETDRLCYIRFNPRCAIDYYLRAYSEGRQNILEVNRHHRNTDIIYLPTEWGLYH